MSTVNAGNGTTDAVISPNTRITIRITESERALIEEEMKRRGMSLSTYCRSKIFADRHNGIPFELLEAIRQTDDKLTQIRTLYMKIFRKVMADGDLGEEEKADALKRWNEMTGLVTALTEAVTEYKNR